MKHQRDSPTGLKEEASHMLERAHEERDHMQELRLVPSPPPARTRGPQSLSRKETKGTWEGILPSLGLLMRVRSADT